jgi:hypothetical protein
MGAGANDPRARIGFGALGTALGVIGFLLLPVGVVAVSFGGWRWVWVIALAPVTLKLPRRSWDKAQP